MLYEVITTRHPRLELGGKLPSFLGHRPLTPGVRADRGAVRRAGRITSYNVCYTRLLRRLEGGADVKAELLYIDIVRNVEKIGDHAFSVSESLAGME